MLWACLPIKVGFSLGCQNALRPVQLELAVTDSAISGLFRGLSSPALSPARPTASAALL